MFDFIRKHTKITMGLLFLLIVPSFVLLGLNDYGQPGAKKVVAEVDGGEITQAEWDAAHRQEVDRLRAEIPGLDMKLLDSPEAKYSTLERLVRERVLSVAAEKLKLVASNQKLADELQSNPQIAMLRKPDGSLDMDRYKQLLSAQGMSPEMFEASVRAEMSTRQVLLGVVGTGAAAHVVADTALNAFFDRREVALARFKSADFTKGLEPSAADLTQFHQSKASQFMVPEQASVQYVVLEAQALGRSIQVSDADLKAYYEQNRQKLAGQEERRASHILINAPKGAAAADREAARTRASELLAQARKAPESFAALARKHSQDGGSAERGGDLDFFARGAMVKPFEDAVFGLAKGQISDLVETDFGFHIIRLTDIRAPKQRSFEDMREELVAEVRKQLLPKKFAEAAEQLSNLVYEQSDSLKPAADKLGLQIQTAEQVGRNGQPGGKGPLNHPKVLAALFSADAIEKKRNTEAIDVGSGVLVAARIAQHSPARQQTLEEAGSQVRAQWLADRSAALAREEGARRLALWEKQPEQARLTESFTLSREEAPRVPVAVFNAAMRADPAALPKFKGVDLGPEGYAIVRIDRVLPRKEREPKELEQARAQYTQWWSNAEGRAYYKLLQERYKVKFLVSRPVGAKG